MAKERTPAKHKPSTASQVKSAWKKLGSSSSLKIFARAQTGSAGELSAAWFFNKKANTSKPPLGIGKTRRKKSKNGAAAPKK